MTELELTPQLGAKLRKYRKQRGFTLHQLATMTQAHKITIIGIEKAEVTPSANLLQRIALALDIPTEELIKEDGVEA